MGTRKAQLALWVSFAFMGCDAQPEPATLSNYELSAAAESDFSRLALTLPVDRDALEEQQGGRMRFEREGLVLRVQMIPTTGEAVARTPESVASALSTRFELGEQPGEIASHPCRYAGSTSATCLVGTFQRGSETWIRRGAVLEAGGQIVWLDVVGPASRVEDVDAFSNEVAELAAVRSAS